ncbi:hypothetical protein OROMI_003008 [Orobanche minor]
MAQMVLPNRSLLLLLFVIPTCGLIFSFLRKWIHVMCYSDSYYNIQWGSEFTFPDELNALKGTTCLFKFEVPNYNIQSKYHHYTVSKLSKDKDEIESFLARKKSIVGGAMYDGCGNNHESSSSISDNRADTILIDSYIKRRRLFSDEDLVVNTDADWESQHSTNVKDQADVVKDVTKLENI